MYKKYVYTGAYAMVVRQFGPEILITAVTEFPYVRRKMVHRVG